MSVIDGLLDKYLLDQMARCDSIHDMCQGTRDKKAKVANMEDLDVQVNGLVKTALDSIDALKYDTLKKQFDTLKTTRNFSDEEIEVLNSLFDEINARKTKSGILQQSANTHDIALNVGDKIDYIEHLHMKYKDSINDLKLSSQYTIKTFEKYPDHFKVTCVTSNKRSRDAATKKDAATIIKHLYVKNHSFDIVNGWKKESELFIEKQHLDPIDKIISFFETKKNNKILYYIDNNGKQIDIPIYTEIWQFKMSSAIHIEAKTKIHGTDIILDSNNYNVACIGGWSDNKHFVLLDEETSRYMISIFKAHGLNLVYFDGKDKQGKTLSKTNCTHDIYDLLSFYRCSNSKKPYTWYISDFNIPSKGEDDFKFNDIVQGDFVLFVFTNAMGADIPELVISVGYIKKLYEAEFDLHDGTTFYYADIVFDDGDVMKMKLYQDYFEKFKDGGWTFCTEKCIKNLQENIKKSVMYKKFDKLTNTIAKYASTQIEYRDHSQFYEDEIYPLCILSEAKLIETEEIKTIKINNTDITFTYFEKSFKCTIPYITNDTFVRKTDELIRNDLKHQQKTIKGKSSQAYFDLKQNTEITDKLAYIKSNLPSVYKYFEKQVTFTQTDYERNDNKYEIHMHMFGSSRKNGWIFQNDTFDTTVARFNSSKYNDKVIQFFHKMKPEIAGIPTQISETTTINGTSNRLQQIIISKDEDEDKIDEIWSKCVSVITTFFSRTTVPVTVPIVVPPDIKMLCETKVDIFESKFKTNLICSVTQFWDSASGNKCGEINNELYKIFPKNEVARDQIATIMYRYDKSINIFIQDGKAGLEYKTCRYITLDGKGDSVYKKPTSRDKDNNYIIKTVDLLRQCIIGVEKTDIFIPNPNPDSVLTKCTKGKYTDHKDINYALDIKRSGDAFMIIEAKSNDAIYVTEDQLAFLQAKLRGVKCILVSKNTRTYNFTCYNPQKPKPVPTPIVNPITNAPSDPMIIEAPSEPMNTNNTSSVPMDIPNIVPWRKRPNLEDESINTKDTKVSKFDYFSSPFLSFLSDKYQMGAVGGAQSDQNELDKTKQYIDLMRSYAECCDDDARDLCIVDFILDNLDNGLYQPEKNGQSRTNEEKTQQNDKNEEKTQHLSFIDDEMWLKFSILYNGYNKTHITHDTYMPMFVNDVECDVKYYMAILFFTRPATISRFIKNTFGSFPNFEIYMHKLKIKPKPHVLEESTPFLQTHVDVTKNAQRREVLKPLPLSSLQRSKLAWPQDPKLPRSPLGATNGLTNGGKLNPKFNMRAALFIHNMRKKMLKLKRNKRFKFP